MIFKWKTINYGVDPQAAGQYLDDLAQRDGGIRPGTMVEEAREPQTLLHPCFEWSDSLAAQKYREDQARGILQNLVIVHLSESTGKEALTTRAFVHISAPDPRYLDIESALSDTQMRAKLLEQAQRELTSIKAKYEGFLELAEIMDAIDHRLAVA
jgi:hypothetical protein